MQQESHRTSNASTGCEANHEKPVNEPIDKLVSNRTECKCWDMITNYSSWSHRHVQLVQFDQKQTVDFEAGINWVQLQLDFSALQSLVVSDITNGKHS